MKVTLKPVKIFEVWTEAGTPLGRFHLDSDWHGFVCLRAPDGDILIVSNPNEGGPFTKVFNDILGTPEDVRVIKASPRLLDLLKMAEEKAQVQVQVQVQAQAQAQAQAQNPSCSVCKDDPNACSKNYSGGWVETPCPQ